jgi:monofunctional glycosyltransferase
MDRSGDSDDFGAGPPTVRTSPFSVRPQPETRPAATALPPQVFDVSKMARPESVSSTGFWPSVSPSVTGATPAQQRTPRLGTALRYAGLALGGWLALVLALIVVYRFVDPPFSARMAGQWLTGQSIDQTFVRLDNMSPNVVRAVLLSEDGRFCDHFGVDLDEMQAAIERANGGIPRGASTISMQLTKNLFLWSSKSYVRKVIEIPLTLVIEAVWPKRRIMEVYLNMAEWGPGIYGVEAASQYHFNKSAAVLNEREAAQLAVTLPNPIRRDAGDPGPQTRRLASDIQARMRAAGWGATKCVASRVRSAAKGR